MTKEEKKVDEGQEEEEIKEPVVDSEVEGEEQGQEEEQEAEEDWEGKYKSLQSKKDKEVEDAKAETLRLKRLVSPYQKNIKETETGDYMFDFSEPEKPKERVTKPEEDLWIDDPKKATEQLITFREQEREDREFSVKEKEKTVQANKTFKADWDKSWDRTKKLYPDADVEGSELQKKASAILNGNPKLGDLSDCNEICFKLAASELNIAPAKEAPSQEKKEEKDISYIVSGKGGKGNKEKKDESEGETPEQYIARRKNLKASKALGVHSQE